MSIEELQKELENKIKEYYGDGFDGVLTVHHLISMTLEQSEDIMELIFKIAELDGTLGEIEIIEDYDPPFDSLEEHDEYFGINKDVE